MDGLNDTKDKSPDAYAFDSGNGLRPIIYNGDLNWSTADIKEPPMNVRSSGAKKTDTGAIKHDQEKLPIDLIPVRPILDLAAVLEHGKIKYDANNWRKGFLYSRTYAAAQRHLLLWFSGVDLDDDSKLNHLAHAMCNIAFLLEFTRTHPELDDRIKQGD